MRVANPSERLLLTQLRALVPEVYPAAKDCLRLFERAYRRRPTKVRMLRSPVLMERLTFFLSRSMFYSNLYEFWNRNLTASRASTFFSRLNAINVFGPVLLQELEGPLKYELAIIRFLLGIDVGKESDWPGSLIQDPSTGRQHTFGHLFSEIHKNTTRYLELRRTMAVFKGTQKKLDFEVLRNALGHSDYWILANGNDLKVHLEAGEESQVIEWDEFLSVFTGVQDLVLGLQMAMLIVMHRLGMRREQS